MSNVDEKIAKLKLMKRMEKEKEEKSKEDVKEEKLPTVEEVMKQIEAGKVVINDKQFIFRKASYLNGKMNIYHPIEFFREHAKNKDNIILVNDIRGISLNCSHVEKGMKSQNIKQIKSGIEQNYKNMKMYLKWVEEGEMETKNAKVLYAAYKTPTAKGSLYNIVFYRNVKGEVIVGNYNCFDKDIKEWELLIKATIRLIEFNY